MPQMRHAAILWAALALLGWAAVVADCAGATPAIVGGHDAPRNRCEGCWQQVPAARERRRRREWRSHARWNAFSSATLRPFPVEPSTLANFPLPACSYPYIASLRRVSDGVHNCGGAAA